MSDSTYPDENRDRHGIPRNIPACDFPARRLTTYTVMERGLAASLVCYVSGDDAELSRKEFLINVRDRIDLDLMTGDHS